jgi:hypothetical protein
MDKYERNPAAFEVQRGRVTCIGGSLVGRGSGVAANVFAQAGPRHKALGAVFRVASDAQRLRRRRRAWRPAPDEARSCRGRASHQAQHDGEGSNSEHRSVC